MIPSTRLTSTWALEYETPADGTYYMRVRENGDNDVGQYFVRADIRVNADDLAGNSSTTGYVAAGGSIIGYHERNDDVDWIAVDLVAGENYRSWVINDERLIVNEARGDNGWYYFGWDNPGFKLVNSSGQEVASGASSYPLNSNLMEFDAASSGRFYIAVDASLDRMYQYVVKFERVVERPVEVARIMQPDSSDVADFRFSDVHNPNSIAINDEILTTNSRTSSLIKFDLAEHNISANYAAIEIYLFASEYPVTGDIVVDIPLNTLNEGSVFGDVGAMEFVTAIKTSGVGKWVTIEITDIYNSWISGERTNNGVLLSSSDFSTPLLSFYSSNYAADPSLRPRLVLDGPDFSEEVYGQTTGAIDEGDASVSGSIGLTGGSAGFAQGVARGSLGTLTVNDQGRVWVYELDSRAEALSEGEIVVENLVVTSGTGISQSIAITVTGKDDAAVVIGAGNHQFAESAGMLSGRAAIADIDAPLAPTFRAITKVGAYGQFAIAADGSWTYKLSNEGALALATNFTGLEQVDLTASDGSAFEFTFAISGTDDDRLVGTANAEMFMSGNGADTVSAGAGGDTLDGGTGADSLVGGTGDDTYIVDNVLDRLRELRLGGMDTVLSSVSLTLTAELEDLTLVGDAAINGTGNTLANRITGNAAANVLNGGRGADTLIGGAGDDLYRVDALDRVVELAGEGADTVSSTGSFSLDGMEQIEVLQLTGGAVANGVGNAGDNRMLGNVAANILTGGLGNDLLQGGAGDDTLRGGEGADTLIGSIGTDRLEGGAGNDIYVLSDADSIGEGADSGIDLVQASISFVLAGHVENLNLTGTAAIDGTGSSRANVLTGNANANKLDGLGGSDILSGGQGNDTLIGGQGADTLTGGPGADTFRFLAVSDRGDVITDYSASDDTLEFSAAGFGGGLAAGMNLGASGKFISNLTGLADAALGQFVFETDTRKLWWDADGTGAGTRFEIVRMQGLTSLAASEVVVIA